VELLQKKQESITSVSPLPQPKVSKRRDCTHKEVELKESLISKVKLCQQKSGYKAFQHDSGTHRRKKKKFHLHDTLLRLADPGLEGLPGSVGEPLVVAKERDLGFA